MAKKAVGSKFCMHCEQNYRDWGTRDKTCRPCYEAGHVPQIRGNCPICETQKPENVQAKAA